MYVLGFKLSVEYLRPADNSVMCLPTLLFHDCKLVMLNLKTFLNLFTQSMTFLSIFVLFFNKDIRKCIS